MHDDRYYYVYILGSLSGTSYVGMTGNLRNRVWQHKHHTFGEFTADYGVDRLLYYERYVNVSRAIGWEKQLKGWRREKKIGLIEKENSAWKDLACDWFLTTECPLAQP